jgi:hypothetical protein
VFQRGSSGPKSVAKIEVYIVLLVEQIAAHSDTVDRCKKPEGACQFVVGVLPHL